MRTISVKLFLFWTSGSGENGVKDISYLELWKPFCSVEGNHFCNFGKGHYKEQFCGIILNLDQCCRMRCCLKTFLI